MKSIKKFPLRGAASIIYQRLEAIVSGARDARRAGKAGRAREF